MEVFVQRLIAGRNRKGLTQTELSKELGVHLRSVQNWEGGLTEPRGKDLRKLSTVLGMSIPFLYGLEEQVPGISHGYLVDETGGEVRQLAHKYLDKLLDTCKGNKPRENWLYVELQNKFPLSGSSAAAVAGASGRRRGRKKT